MPGLNTDVVNNITGTAIGKLKKQLRGGVTTQSAIDAINDTAQAFKTVTEKELGASQREINQLRQEANISATRIAKLTSERDAVVLQKNGLQSELDTSKSLIEQLKAKLRAALGVRVGKPVELPNGNIRTVKTNKNGAVMTTETLPNGRKVSVEVQTPNGVRKTTYDPVTGKPLKTYTDISGSQIIEYDANGISKTPKKVNNKKVKPQKPTVVSRQIIGTENGVTTTRKTFSDGSYEIGNESVYRNNGVHPISTERYNSDNKKIQSTAYRFNQEKVTKEITNFDPETGKITSVQTKFGVLEGDKEVYDSSCEYFLNERRETYKKVTVFEELGGLKQIISAKVNEFGLVDKSNPSMKYIYPKSSKIKSSTVIFKSQFDAKKEILKLRNGSTVEISVNNNYDPYEVIIKEKDKPDVKLSNHQAILNYLESIGKVTYIKDNSGWNQIYYNHLR